MKGAGIAHASGAAILRRLQCFGTTRLPKQAARCVERLREMLGETHRGLAGDIVRYIEICELGAEALSKCDREIAHGGDDAMARASALALKHNHIAWGKRRVRELQTALKAAEKRLAAELAGKAGRRGRKGVRDDR